MDTDAVSSLYFCKDDTDRIISASRDRSVRIWKVQSGMCISVIDGHCAPVENVFMINDEVIAAVCGGPSFVYQWSLKETNMWMEDPTVNGTHSQPLKHMAVSPCGSTVAVVGLNTKIIEIWSVTGLCQYVTEPAHTYTTLLQYISDTALMVGLVDGCLCLYELYGNSYECVHVITHALAGPTLHMHSRKVPQETGNAVCACIDGNRLCVHTVKSKKNEFEITGEHKWRLSQKCVAVHLSPNTRSVRVLAASGRHMFIYDIGEHTLLHSVSIKPSMALTDMYYVMNMTNNALLLVDVSEFTIDECDDTIEKAPAKRVKNVAVGPPYLDGHTHEVTCICTSMNDTYIATGCMNGCIHIWHTSSSKCLWILHTHTRSVTALAFDDTETPTKLVSVSNDSTIVVWNMEILQTHNKDTAALTPMQPDVLAQSRPKHLFAHTKGMSTHKFKVFSITSK